MPAGVSVRLAVVAVTIVAAGTTLHAGPAEPVAPLVVTASGSVTLESSKDGEALLSVSGFRPGDSADGSLTLTSRTTAPQRLTLATTDLADRPGPRGGLLSGHLELRVERLGGALVWEGRLADLSRLDLGELAGGESQTYRLIVTLPERGPAVDDSFAGSEVDVTWTWRGDGEGGAASDSPPGTESAGGGEGAAPGAGAPGAGQQVGASGSEAPAHGGAAEPASVWLWLGGGRAQRLAMQTGRAARGARGRRAARGGSLVLLARCRPDCRLDARVRVLVRRRWRTLRPRTLRAVPVDGSPARVMVTLTPRELRMMGPRLRRGRRVPVRLTVRATAPGHAAATATRTVRVRR